jgi:NAD(P)-dependent dehydrogenase (short-subunit alcohol dehydrogenase family)
METLESLLSSLDPKKTVYIRGISKYCTIIDIINHFSSAGDINENDIIFHPINKGIIYITYHDEDSVKKAIQTVIDKYERIDVSFNIASNGGVYSNMHNMPETVWDKVVVNNLTGQFYCVKYELQQFLKQGGGVIVNMYSLLDIETSKGLIPYTVSLHSVLGITKNIAFQYASDNIRANAICPSYAENISIGPVNRDFNKSLFEGIPTSKPCSPKDIAKAFIYLASDDSMDCNGTQIIIDEDSE